MHLLFTVDDNYLKHIPVVLSSIYVNEPNTKCDVHIICRKYSNENHQKIENLCNAIGYGVNFYSIPEHLFDGATITKRYPKEMYYRLLAAEILPSSLEKIIYIDPDVLVINPLSPLWNTEMDGNIFLASTHLSRRESIQKIDNVRLGIKNAYFNTGVLVMDLQKMRREVHKEEIFACLEEYKSGLLLPDQDVFNILYGDRTKAVPDEIWNYDARRYRSYLSGSSGEMDEKWVIENTAILHFCGKSKPWNKRYPHRFGLLYLHYMSIAKRLTEYTKD